jgi:hypothetical protein
MNDTFAREEHGSGTVGEGPALGLPGPTISYVSPDDQDEEQALRLGLSIALRRARQERQKALWLLIPGLKDLERSAVKEVLGARFVRRLLEPMSEPTPLTGVNVYRHTAHRGRWPGGRPSVFLVLFPSQRLLDRIDDELRFGHFVVVAPRSPAVSAWLEIWGAFDASRHQHLPPTDGLPDEVETALADLDRAVDRKDALALLPDRGRVAAVVCNLLGEGLVIEEAAARRWLLRRGWTHRGAERILAVVRRESKFFTPAAGAGPGSAQVNSMVDRRQHRGRPRPA